MKSIYAYALLGVVLAIAVTGCITVRQSGAHDIQVTTYGSGNKFEAHTERQNSAQEGTATPTIDVKPTTDLTIPVVP